MGACGSVGGDTLRFFGMLLRDEHGGEFSCDALDVVDRVALVDTFCAGFDEFVIE